MKAGALRAIPGPQIFVKTKTLDGQFRIKFRIFDNPVFSVELEQRKITSIKQCFFQPRTEGDLSFFKVLQEIEESVKIYQSLPFYHFQVQLVSSVLTDAPPTLMGPR